MSLTEIMSSAGLTFWPIAGLVLFMFAFVLIGVRTFSKSSRKAQSEAAAIPLDDARVITPRETSDRLADKTGGEA